MDSSEDAPTSIRRDEENSGGLHAEAGMGTRAHQAIRAQTHRRRRTWGIGPRIARWERNSGHTQGTQAVQLARTELDGKGSERGIELDQNIFKDRGAWRAPVQRAEKSWPDWSDWAGTHAELNPTLQQEEGRRPFSQPFPFFS